MHAVDGPPRHYRGRGIAFEYPRTWSHRRRGWIATIAENFLDLGTQPVGDPCRTRGNSTSCGLPAEHLRRNGVLVSWVIEEGMPLRDRPRPGTRVTVERPGACRAVHASEAISARVVTARHEILLVTACLRGPRLHGNAVAVRAMLASVRSAG